ncbi:hypothetical protein RHMOL_Rhmol01G0184600 [Rhododendron molle]|uniref:Uncharacterized protein n=1 Tax=Rhododendron molle TaxID=49168 RepID=A0ACC0Q5K0_RHOML|nr:hypothetical protein RHMOL_Rhmol01G0184600 [Rhododendron molle]
MWANLRIVSQTQNNQGACTFHVQKLMEGVNSLGGVCPYPKTLKFVPKIRGVTKLV